MMNKIARKMRGEEQGFTLIELMVVVLIIGILIAIALPTFLGARARGQDKQSQSSLRNGLAAAKTCYTDKDSYVVGVCDSTGGPPSALTQIEPTLTYELPTVASGGANDLSVKVKSDVIWIATSVSKSGKCFAIKDDQTSGTTYQTVASGACTANNADTLNVWTATW